MRHTISSYKKKKWLALGLVSLALVALLIVAACGESATATPEPAATDPSPNPPRLWTKPPQNRVQPSDP